MKSISVAIPVRIVETEQYDSLLRCLDSVFSQTVEPIDVIISVDGSSIKLEQKLRKFFKSQYFRVIENPLEPGIATNSNNALARCTGDLVHVLHQDDEILSLDCYANVLEKFELEGFGWLLLGGETKQGEEIVPIFDSYTKFGVNKIGGPSGLIVPRQSYLPFNPHYSMMTDVVNFEYYFKMYGLPTVLPSTCIHYGDLRSSASRNIPREVIINELKLIVKEFDVSVEETIIFINDPKIDANHRKLVFDSLKSSLGIFQKISFLIPYGIRKIVSKANSISKQKLVMNLGN